MMHMCIFNFYNIVSMPIVLSEHILTVWLTCRYFSVAQTVVVSQAPASFAPTTVAPTSFAPTLVLPAAFPTASPVSGPTTSAPTVAPEDESILAVSLTSGQTVANMTEGEKSSFRFNTLLAVIERLNGVNAGNGVTLTTNDATRTTLSDSSTARRRDVTVYFAAYFAQTTVNTTEAFAAAATITTGNPIVISYLKADSSTASATATSAAALAGTNPP